MKKTTKEYNMTVVTIVAIAAILGFFWAIWQKIQKQISKQWNTATGEEGNKGNNDPDAVNKFNVGYIITEHLNIRLPR